MSEAFDRDELRKLVREVLRSTLQGTGRVEPAAQPANLLEAMRQAILPSGSGEIEVQGDLNDFARDIVHAAGHEDLKAAIMTGRLKFSPNRKTAAREKKAENPVSQDGAYRFDNGMLTEIRLAEIGKHHKKIVLGPQVVVTPLARDRARELKLELVRSKS